MAKLTAPNGASVEVADERVETLLRLGFTQPKVKSSTSKSASSKSSK